MTIILKTFWASIHQMTLVKTVNLPSLEKKPFSVIKNSKQDNQGIPLLKKGDSTYTTTQDKTNALNAQFQSVFSIRSPLNLAKLCKSKVLDNISLLGNMVPESLRCKYPTMPEIKISTNGVANLLSNLNIAKAAGPDTIKPVVLKELSHIIAPAVAALFQKSLDEGTVPSDWKKAQVCPLYKKKAANRKQLITAQSPSRAYSLRLWSTSLLLISPNILTDTIFFMISSTAFVKGDHVKHN